ncbi:MAG: autotransporter adhesin [Parcubacteria group bacterium Gr01-1014_24]|nr:MAG: autotransporter adhesin [Parcubacteria group bacterium Gr01-1014_24]
MILIIPLYQTKVMTLFFKLVIFALIISLLPSFVFAQVGACSPVGYSIFTINGINTDQRGAQENKKALEDKLTKIYKNEFVTIDFLHNPSHAGGALDLIDAVQQGLFDEKSDYDLIEMWNDASQKVTTQKLLLVGHSQGNFYANNFYDKVTDRGLASIPRESIGVYGVATPASHVAGGGNYITSDTDRVIAARVGRVLKILPPNTHILFQLSDDPDGHSFSDVYLKYQGAKIVSDIESSLEKLQTNNMQNVYMPCINPPAVTFAHELQRNLLSFVDHPIDSGKAGIALAKNTVKKVGLAIGNKVIQIASNAYSFAKSFTNKNPNNAAAVILAGIPASQDTSSEPTENSTKENLPTKVGTPTESVGAKPVVDNVPIADTEKTPPDLPLSGEAVPPDKGESEGVVPEISHPSLLPGGGGVAAANLPLPYQTPYSTPYSTPYATPYPTPAPADTTPPVISALTLTPNSGSKGVGGTVTLTITADGANYTAGTITVNGVATTGFTNAGGNIYTATYTVVSGNTNRASGTVPASVILTDAVGNSNVAYTTVAANTLIINGQVANSAIQIFPTFASTGEFTQDIILSCVANSGSRVMYAISDTDNSYNFMNESPIGPVEVFSCSGSSYTAMGNGQKFSGSAGYANYVGWYYVATFLTGTGTNCAPAIGVACVPNAPYSFARLHRNNSDVWSDSDI